MLGRAKTARMDNENASRPTDGLKLQPGSNDPTVARTATLTASSLAGTKQIEEDARSSSAALQSHGHSMATNSVGKIGRLVCDGRGSVLTYDVKTAAQLGTNAWSD